MLQEDRLHLLSAKLEIQDALMLYARGLDRLDAETAASAYHEDGMDHNGGSPITGRQFVTETVIMLRETYRATRHLLTNTLTEVHGDEARSETYYSAWHRFERDGRLLDLLIAGRYLDRMTHRDNVWRIQWRWRVRDWSRIDSVLETWEPAPGWPLAERSREDPLYRLLLKGD
jgi:SnoaL-like domain